MKKTLFLILVILSVVTVPTDAAVKDAVKIAVASNGKDAAASISNKAEKCAYYLIFDGTGELIEAADNPNKDLQIGAGPLHGTEPDALCSYGRDTLLR